MQSLKKTSLLVLILGCALVAVGLVTWIIQPAAHEPVPEADKLEQLIHSSDRLTYARAGPPNARAAQQRYHAFQTEQNALRLHAQTTIMEAYLPNQQLPSLNTIMEKAPNTKNAKAVYFWTYLEFQNLLGENK